MRKLLVISMAFVMLALIFSGCENAGESGSSITQSEAEAGLAEVGTNIEKASAAPPSSDTTSDDGSTNTITYNNVSYDGSIIDGTIEVTGTDSDMTISFDSLAVDSYIINGSMNMKFTAIDDSTYQVDFTSTINITGGTV